MVVWQSINVTLDQGLRTKLFEGEINVFKCDVCGEKASVGVPLLYHDMVREFCVQYYPPESLKDSSFYDGFDSEGHVLEIEMLEIPEETGSYITHPHVVFSLSEMIHYVLFREGVFDKHENR